MIRFGLIGAGRIAERYVEAFASARNAELVAIADLDRATAARLATSAGCSDVPVAGISQLADAVVICTPPSTHAAVARGCIAERLHVLCEKPFTITSDDASAMIAEARAAGVLITMASKFRYMNDLRTAQMLVQGYAIGDLYLVELAFRTPVSMVDRWNSDARISGGGVFIDNGTHAVDVVRAIAGPIAAVKALRGPQTQPLPVEDEAHAFMRCVDGTLASTDLSWSSKAATDVFLRLRGTRGSIAIGWNGSFVQRGKSEWTRFGNGYDRSAAFRSQLENFADAIDGRDALAVTPLDASASVAVIEAGYAAMGDHTWHAVETHTQRTPVGAA